MRIREFGPVVTRLSPSARYSVSAASKARSAREVGAAHNDAESVPGLVPPKCLAGHVVHRVAHAIHGLILLTAIVTTTT